MSLLLCLMNARCTLLRIFGTLAVVAGVFSMHALTADHELAMATNHATAAHLDMADNPMTKHQVALPLALVDGFERVAVEPADGQHGMVGDCLAVLSGLLLLLALALGLRSLLAWRPVFLLPTAPPVRGERSPPWLAPSLSKLCVLRT